MTLSAAFIESLKVMPAQGVRAARSVTRVNQLPCSAGKECLGGNACTSNVLPEERKIY
jgi:hypothetical protein